MPYRSLHVFSLDAINRKFKEMYNSMRGLSNRIKTGQSTEVDATDSIPFNSGNSVIAPLTVTGPVTFDIDNTLDSVAGSGASRRVTADGVNEPVLTGFKEMVGSPGYDNTDGVVNLFLFYFDGVDYWYSVTQDANPATTTTSTTTTTTGTTTTTTTTSSTTTTTTAGEPSFVDVTSWINPFGGGISETSTGSKEWITGASGADYGHGAFVPTNATASTAFEFICQNKGTGAQQSGLYCAPVASGTVYGVTIQSDNTVRTYHSGTVHSSSAVVPTNGWYGFRRSAGGQFTAWYSADKVTWTQVDDGTAGVINATEMRLFCDLQGDANTRLYTPQTKNVL